MSANRPSTERMKLPAAGQWLVIAAAALGAWIIWSESRDRGWIPGLARPPANPNARAPVKPAPPVSIPPLIAELSNEVNPNARREALLKLASVGPAAAEALDAIRERLNDEEEGVRYAAVLALARVSQDPAVFLPELRARLNDPNTGVQDVAADMLVTIGPPATSLAIELLDRESPATRSRALSILRRIVCPETFPEISAAIEKLSHDPNADVSPEALVTLADWGMIDQAGIRALLRTDRTISGARPGVDDRKSRDIALQAIAWLGPEAADLVPELIALLEEYPDLEIAATRSENGRQVQYRTLAPGVVGILSALSALKTAARPAVPYLLGRLNGLDRDNKMTVLGTLFEIGAEPETLKAAMPDRVENVGYYNGLKTGKLLASIDPEAARRQVTELIQRLSDPNRTLDEKDFGDVGALAGFGPAAKGAIPFLISLLSDKRPGAAYYAASALGQFGPDAAPAVPKIIAGLEQARLDGSFLQGGWRHHEKFEMLRSIGPAADQAVPLLLAVLNDLAPAVSPTNGEASRGRDTSRGYAISALGAIAVDAPEVNQVICRELSGESDANRAVAVRALANSKQDVPRALAAMIGVLEKHTPAYDRMQAAIAIGALSGGRQRAAVALGNALADSNMFVRKAAAISLGALGPEAKSALPGLHRALLEARCGIPVDSFWPAQGVNSMALSRDNQLNLQLPLVRVLLNAIREIEQAE